MKTTKLVMLVMTIAVALFILIPNLSWAADDGATIYKAKCAMPATERMQRASPQPRFRAWFRTRAKKTSDDDMAKDVAEKAKHPGTVKSLTPDQVKMIVSYIRSLQK